MTSAPPTDADESAAARELVAVARHLSSRGLSPGSSGNLSVRVGAVILLTPTGSSLARVREEDVSSISLDGRSLRGPRPTKEWPLHVAVYAASADVRAVVHLHAPATTAVACLPPAPDGGADLPAYTPYRVMTLGEVPLLPYADPGSADTAPARAAVAAGARALLMAHHGSLCCADTLSRAADRAEELEAAARLTLDLRGSGAPELPREVIGRLRRR